MEANTEREDVWMSCPDMSRQLPDKRETVQEVDL
jgi:hypothetical protein